MKSRKDVLLILLVVVWVSACAKQSASPQPTDTLKPEPTSQADDLPAPGLVESVFLFHAGELVDVLQARGVKLGVATSVRRGLWDEAEIYPRRRSGRLRLTEEQRRLLSLFGGQGQG